MSERPDTVSSALLNGKIVVLIDGSPFALIMPSFMLDFFNPASDQYFKPINVSFIKILRMLCFVFSILVPAYYIAITTYNQENYIEYFLRLFIYKILYYNLSIPEVIIVDLDYSNPIDIEIYEATRFTGGVDSDPSDKMCFRPTMDKQQMIHDVITPDTLTYELEVDTIQRAIKERQVIHDINTTPKVTSKQPMDVAIKSPFTLSYHPLRLDVHQAGAKYYGDTELHIKTLDVKSRDAIEVLSFERITDQYGVDFTVYTPNTFPADCRMDVATPSPKLLVENAVSPSGIIQAARSGTRFRHFSATTLAAMR